MLYPIYYAQYTYIRVLNIYISAHIHSVIQWDMDD